MPFIYKKKGGTQEGGTLPGAVVDGALVIGKDCGVAPLANGAPGQVLSISDKGRLLWTEIAASETLPVERLYVSDGDEWVLTAGGALD